MSLFRNNYKELVQENNDTIAKIPAASFAVLDRMFQYLETFDVSRFELEVIKKDLLGLAEEAQMEEMNLGDKIGMPEKEFCDSLVEGGIRRSHIERIMPMIVSTLAELLLFYVIDWLFAGVPKDYGISIWVVLLAGFSNFYNGLVVSKLRGKSVYKAEWEKKGMSVFNFVILCAAGIFLFMDIPVLDIFLVRGNGKMISGVLLIISMAAFLLNNYYWNKCSEKYNWR